MTPNDPRLTFNPITKVEGLKLMYMFESYGLAIYNGRVIVFFRENDLLTPVTPNDPNEFQTHYFDTGYLADAYA